MQTIALAATGMLRDGSTSECTQRPRVCGVFVLLGRRREEEVLSAVRAWTVGLFHSRLPRSHFPSGD